MFHKAHTSNQLEETSDREEGQLPCITCVIPPCEPENVYFEYNVNE